MTYFQTVWFQRTLHRRWPLVIVCTPQVARKIVVCSSHQASTITIETVFCIEGAIKNFLQIMYLRVVSITDKSQSYVGFIVVRQALNNWGEYVSYDYFLFFIQKPGILSVSFTFGLVTSEEVELHHFILLW